MMSQPEIRDIHLPADVSWWPPATGYWLLLALLILLGISAYLLYSLWQRRSLRRAALAELKKIETDFKQHHDQQLLAQQLSVLLRRAAVSCFSRQQCAHLTGDAWLKFLDQQFRKKTAQGFSSSAGQLLLTAPYQQQCDIDQAASLLKITRAWLSQLPAGRFAVSASSGNERKRETAGGNAA